MVGSSSSHTHNRLQNSGKNTALILDAEVVQRVHDLLGEKYGEMVEIYIKGACQYVTEIERALHDRDVEAAVIPSHTLKSISKQIGAMRLSEIARDFEDSVRNPEIDREDFINGLFDMAEELGDSLVQTIDALDNMNI